jgi:hypothetical protein
MADVISYSAGSDDRTIDATIAHAIDREYAASTERDQ